MSEHLQYAYSIGINLGSVKQEGNFAKETVKERSYQ